MFGSGSGKGSGNGAAEDETLSSRSEGGLGEAGGEAEARPEGAVAHKMVGVDGIPCHPRSPR